MDRVPCPSCHNGMDFGQELCPQCRAKALKDAKNPAQAPTRADAGGWLIPLLFLAALAVVAWTQRVRLKAMVDGLKAEAAGSVQQGPKDQPQPTPAEETK